MPQQVLTAPAEVETVLVPVANATWNWNEPLLICRRYESPPPHLLTMARVPQVTSGLTQAPAVIRLVKW